MWKLKLASKLVGGPKIPGLGGSKEKKWCKYARIGGLITSGLLAVLGILDIPLYTAWVGAYCLLAAFVVLVAEFPWAPVQWMANALTFFQDYRWRAVAFVLIGIPTFFSFGSIAAGLACIITGGLYGFAAFKEEEGDPVKVTTILGKEKSAPGAVPKEREMEASKKKPLASTDETHA